MTNSSDVADYEVYAIRYATNTRRTRGQNFLKEPNPTVLLTMDFFCWFLRRGDETIVVDTGMAKAKAERNGHEFLVNPVDVMRRLGVDPLRVRTVIMTHLHYDHAGHVDEFPHAKFFTQAEEMAYVTGPYMEKAWFRHAYDVDEIQTFVGFLHAGRLKLHGRDYEVADGVSVHWVGGHTAGQEIVRIKTRRGYVVLASDALHYEEELEKGIPFSVAFNISDMMMAHDRVRELADSDDHVIVAHDPRLMEHYPAASAELAGFAVRVDLPPRLT